VSGDVPAVTPEELERLDRAVARALDSPDAPRPEILGFGEISCALALDADAGAVACKRLPPFPSDGAFQTYRECFEDQLERLRAGGISVLPTRLQRLPGGTRTIAYCVQPRVDADALLPSALRRADEGQGRLLLDSVLELALSYVSPTRGLDAQLSNWALLDARLVYLDVTTPLLRDERGRERLDLGIFLASLPWALRGFVRRFLLRDVLDAYYEPRTVVLDVLGNLIKEGLDDRLPELVPLAAERMGQPLGLREVRRHYARDARLWELLQRLRRLDRAWQQHVRRRPYPFLLPGPVRRHV
jgi:hypothetical protein